MRKIKKEQAERRAQYEIWVAENAEEKELKSVLLNSRQNKFDPQSFFQ